MGETLVEAGWRRQAKDKAERSAPQRRKLMQGKELTASRLTVILSV